MKYRMAVLGFALLGLLSAGRTVACDSSCPQSFVQGSAFPYVEMISSNATTITGNANPALAQWVVVDQPCTSGELQGNQAFNAVVRAQYSLDGATVSVGSNFETRITIFRTSDGAVMAQSAYTRKIRGTIDGSNIQGEWFNAYADALAGNTGYDMRLEVRALASGTIHVSLAWITAQGSPTANGGGSSVNSSQQMVGSSWVKLSEATFTNSASENVDVVLQSYLQFVSGNPGDQILVGMGVDNISSNGHNSVIYVPSAFPDGINGFDNIPNVGNNFTIAPGTHVFQLWAKNASGGSTTVQYAQIQGIGFPVSNGAVQYTDVSGPFAAHSDWSTSVEPQPHACLMLDDSRANTQVTSCSTDGSETPFFGTWTKVATVTFAPANSSTGYNWMGQGYVEFLGRTSTWGNAWCQIAVENIANGSPEAAVENGEVSFNVPIVNSQAYFFLDAHRWGTGYGNTVNLWVRKVTKDGDQGSFTVGRAYIGGRIVDAGTATCEQ